MSHVNIGGTWREFDKSWVNIGGTWHEVDKMFVNIGGVWKEGWASFEEWLVAVIDGNMVKVMPNGTTTTILTGVGSYRNECLVTTDGIYYRPSANTIRKLDFNGNTIFSINAQSNQGSIKDFVVSASTIYVHTSYYGNMTGSYDRFNSSNGTFISTYNIPYENDYVTNRLDVTGANFTMWVYNYNGDGNGSDKVKGPGWSTKTFNYDVYDAKAKNNDNTYVIYRYGSSTTNIKLDLYDSSGGTKASVYPDGITNYPPRHIFIAPNGEVYLARKRSSSSTDTFEIYSADLSTKRTMSFSFYSYPSIKINKKNEIYFINKDKYLTKRSQSTVIWTMAQTIYNPLTNRAVGIYPGNIENFPELWE